MWDEWACISDDGDGCRFGSVDNVDRGDFSGIIHRHAGCLVGEGVFLPIAVGIDQWICS